MIKVSKQVGFGIITLLFFYLGFITVLVDSLIPRLRELFQLTYFQSGLVQFAFFSAYFLLSIPSSWILSKLSYRWGIIIGLGAMALGCFLFYPAAQFRVFGIFIAGYFILAGGMTLMQVAINPYVTLFGAESQASSRLTLAQAFNSLGTSIAPLVGASFILSDKIKTESQILALNFEDRLIYLDQEASAVQGPFVFIAITILLTSLAFLRIRLPEVSAIGGEHRYRDLFRHRNLVLGTLGIFFYVGAEVAIGSYLVNYFLDIQFDEVIKQSSLLTQVSESLLQGSLVDFDSKAIVGVFVAFYWTGAMVGRFFGSWLNKVFRPGNVLATFGLAALVFIACTIIFQGAASAFFALSIGLCNSIMFPTIFSLAIGGLGELKSKASGMLCTAIVGGALIPPSFGFFADQWGFKSAFVFVSISYLFITGYGIYQRFNRTSTAL